MEKSSVRLSSETLQCLEMSKRRTQACLPVSVSPGLFSVKGGSSPQGADRATKFPRLHPILLTA